MSNERQPKAGIISGQHLGPDIIQRARDLRRSMTPEERKLRHALRARRSAGLHFRRQQVIDSYIADFYCHAASLVVEVDGSIHAGRRDYDLERDQILASRGLRIRRVTNEEVRNQLADVLARIATACQQQLTRLTSQSRIEP